RNRFFAFVTVRSRWHGTRFNNREDLSNSTIDRLLDSPWVFPHEFEHRRCRGGGGIEARRRPNSLVAIPQEDHCEGTIRRISHNGLHRQGTGIPIVLGLHPLVGDFPKRLESPSTQHAIGHLMYCRKNATHFASGESNRAVRVRPISLFHISVAMKQK